MCHTKPYQRFIGPKSISHVLMTVMCFKILNSLTLILNSLWIESKCTKCFGFQKMTRYMSFIRVVHFMLTVVELCCTHYVSIAKILCIFLGVEGCCVIKPPSIEPSIAGLITHDSFLLSSEAVPTAQLQTPVYLNTCFPSLWALLL